MNLVDPFSYKQFSKLNPTRIWFTLKARFKERSSSKAFSKFELPFVLPYSVPPEIADYDVGDTAVTPHQMQVLLVAIRQTESLAGSCVEIGGYRGVTTSILAAQTTREYLVVDPYFGYGGAESDYHCMIGRVTDLANVRHLLLTSGQASAEIQLQTLTFVFVDAVHDYVNALFDGHTWGEKLMSGGLIAFHDTDNLGFAGVQRAVWEILHHSPTKYTLFAHVDGLVVLQRI